MDYAHIWSYDRPNDANGAWSFEVICSGGRSAMSGMNRISGLGAAGVSRWGLARYMERGAHFGIAKVGIGAIHEHLRCQLGYARVGAGVGVGIHAHMTIYGYNS